MTLDQSPPPPAALRVTAGRGRAGAARRQFHRWIERIRATEDDDLDHLFSAGLDG